MSKSRKPVPKTGAQRQESPIATAAGAAPRDLSSLCLDPGKPAEVRAKILLDVLRNAEEMPGVPEAVLADLLRQTAGRTAP